MYICKSRMWMQNRILERNPTELPWIDRDFPLQNLSRIWPPLYNHRGNTGHRQKLRQVISTQRCNWKHLGQAHWLHWSQTPRHSVGRMTFPDTKHGTTARQLRLYFGFSFEASPISSPYLIQFLAWFAWQHDDVDAVTTLHGHQTK